MSKSSILIYGKTTEQKGQFAYKLAGIERVHADATLPALISRKDKRLDRDYNYLILDPRYQHLLPIYCRDVDIAIYFVDEWNENIIHNQLMVLNKANPSMQILVMGIPREGQNQSLIHLGEIASFPTMWFSQCSEDELEQVRTLIDQTLMKRETTKTNPFRSEKRQTPMDRAIDCTLPGSPLYHALKELEEQMQELPPSTADAIALATEKLMLSWQKTEPVDTASYLKECEIHLHGENYKLCQALATVAIISAITLSVALIGFAIGFGVGLWAGPGAFLSGIIAGTVAVDVVLSSLAVGTGIGGLIAYGIFKPDPVTQAANKVVKEIINPTYIHLDTDL